MFVLFKVSRLPTGGEVGKHRHQSNYREDNRVQHNKERRIGENAQEMNQSIS